ncbi:MAG: SoxR reducing system RseC family protein [Clostridia bacterium]|nr:SoxR reducing system RseC family protein [Clostridia bacterium]
MQEKAKIIKTKNNKAIARVNRKSACGTCGMCAIKPKDLFIDLTVENTLNANVGDEVLIEVSIGSVAKMSLVAYLIPLVLGIVFLTAFYFLVKIEWLTIVAFFVGTALGFLIVSIIDKKVYNKQKNQPKMVAIVTVDDNLIKGE